MRRRFAPVFALALATLVACGATPPSGAPTAGASSAAVAPTASGATPRPTAEPSPKPAWQDASVEHPAAVNGFASQPPGYFCDPCHNLSEDNLFGVGPVRGGFLAVGAVTPPASAVALWSADGRAWTPVTGFAPDNGSAAVAVANAGGRTVLVGHDPTGAIAWAGDVRSGFGRAPLQASLQVRYAAGGMTVVVPLGTGFVAAGYRDDPSRALAEAAVWRSADGLNWTLDAAGDAFRGGRILGLVAQGNALVAVGTRGEQIRGPAAAWRWTASTGWQSATVPPGGGAMRAVATTPHGLVAVGIDAADSGAMAWTSPDGSTWTAVADQPAFHFYDLPVRLQALTAVGDRLVAAGWRSDPGKGSSVIVTSQDGLAWQQLSWQASFSGGQIDGLASAGTTVVAVGRVGYPDTNTAAVWVRDWP